MFERGINEIIFRYLVCTLVKRVLGYTCYYSFGVKSIRYHVVCFISF